VRPFDQHLSTGTLLLCSSTDGLWLGFVPVLLPFFSAPPSIWRAIPFFQVQAPNHAVDHVKRRGRVRRVLSRRCKFPPLGDSPSRSKLLTDFRINGPSVARAQRTAPLSLPRSSLRHSLKSMSFHRLIPLLRNAFPLSSFSPAEAFRCRVSAKCSVC